MTPQDFDVDSLTGFFPPKPLPKLPANFSIWEEALSSARGTIYLANNQSAEALAKRSAGERWRATIRQWPILDIAPLRGELRYLQRAHKVLAFILHYYAHSVVRPDESTPVHIPRSLAIPLVAVSKELAIAPVLTFADVVLWNWEFNDPTRPLTIDNLHYVDLLSGSQTEEAFYTSSAAVELKGVEMLQIIESFVNLASVTDASSISKIQRDLVQLKTIVEELTEIFLSIREAVDPRNFYWLCRPWWVGAETKANSPPSWVFEGVPNYASFDLAGPSAGQSSVMHALDIFLDVDHKLNHSRQPAPSDAHKKADRGFMERMRRYMPGLHREYLQRIGDVPRTVRQVAEANPSLREPYNAVVAGLKHLRDVHMRIACLYVINQANSTPPPSAGIVVTETRSTEGARGTGGNHVASLLKAGRDATRRTMLPEN
ncbi:Indoleamine 2,3-dioxygenase [Panus rudis PR-1116 ss-1]|nr:Indoleamine 2,3-dioxygenase [Panus rudis PR-1116 ss-1]